MAGVLEYGNCYFLYRPKVQTHAPSSEEDVQRLYLVLSPHGKRLYRLIVIGQKRLPEVQDGGDRYWGFVERLTESATALRSDLEETRYQTKTRGERTVPAARPAGEGVYAVVRHGDHTHLAYELELPKALGEVQRALNITEEASYILSIKNPKKPSPHSAGLGKERRADYPGHLKEAFRGKRFVPADPVELMDYGGAQLVLIGAREDPEQELGIRLDTEDENEASAEIFSDLRLRKSANPIEPLFEGAWR